MRLHIARFHSGNAPLRALLAAVATGPLMLGGASAGQLTYTPVNPSFGGSPLNGSYMLQSAQAQKRYPMPMDDYDLGNGNVKVLNAGNYPVIQVGSQVYIYDAANGGWVLFDPNTVGGAGTTGLKSSALATESRSLLGGAPAQTDGKLDSGVVQ
ncbi:curli assembly protein CsgF [Castellaniella caeni]|uniref:curli assembly protein CsgF n=1 Tax=Castellaniella caeni TaxID=266123 RepID=UPI000ADEDF70|nr:curli assembly protein CsgF [Castellaniella caeni]